MIHIPTEKLADFEKNIRREWTMTNGIGGYAGGSIIGACNRTHQGYLIASLHPPVERYLVFSKTNEKLTQGTHVYNLETSQHAGKGHSPIRTQGQRFLTDFSCDGSGPAAGIKHSCDLLYDYKPGRGSRTFHHPAYEFPGAQCIVCRF